jgi:hypothetical protein
VIRAWFSLVWKSAGVAIVAAAAQLGVAETVGILRWTDGSADAWSTLLTWVTFIYAVSVLVGASVGRRAVRQVGRPDRVSAAFVAALSAGVGGAVASSLAWLSAQHAAVAVSAYPELVVATTAGAGLIVGVVLAVLAAVVLAIGVGIRATVAWIWLVGIGSAIAGYVTHEPFRAPRLAVIDAPSVIPVTWWSGPNLMIAVAAVVGLLVAAVARSGGAGRLSTAFAGFAGPSVIAAAYVIAMPGTKVAQSAQLEPYRAAAIAVGAGLLASALVALLQNRSRTSSARPAAARATSDTPSAPTGGATGRPRATYFDRLDDDTGVVPAPVRGPEPTVMGQPQSAHAEDYSDWLRELGHAPGSRTDDSPG